MGAVLPRCAYYVEQNIRHDGANIRHNYVIVEGVLVCQDEASEDMNLGVVFSAFSSTPSFIHFPLLYLNLST
eukprot:scaffold19855_cov72-Skeletonema_marinoi.AAC.1